MVAFHPFEPTPHLAVALSGGPDSLALLHFARRWVAAEGGRLTALTVDHALRAESGAESSAVAARMSALGVNHEVLVWHGVKPTGGVQAAARQARYRLLTQWCEQHGVLHLLLGHQALDQAETVAMRAARHSGSAGRAGMSARLYLPGMRLLRPLLAVAPNDLRSALRHLGESWLEDPSNSDPTWTRSRLRRALLHQDSLLAGISPEGSAPVGSVRVGDDAAEGVAVGATVPIGSRPGCAEERGSAWWLSQATRAATVRRADEEANAMLAARHVLIDARGFARLTAWRSLPAEALIRLIDTVSRTVGATSYPRRRAATHAVLRLKAGAAAVTLAGCHILSRGDGLLVVREVARTRPVAATAHGVWDKRMRFQLEPCGTQYGMTVAALTVQGWSVLRRLQPDLVEVAPPAPARFVLPALWQGNRLLAVPGLGLWPGYFVSTLAAPPFSQLTFEAPQTVAAPPFAGNLH